MAKKRPSKTQTSPSKSKEEKRADRRARREAKRRRENEREAAAEPDDTSASSGEAAPQRPQERGDGGQFLHGP